jgi:hypothetical protein
MPNETERIHAHLLKTVCARINSIIPIPDDVQMSLAGALNLLFLLIGTHGSVGAYITTLKPMRILVGYDLLWADTPAKAEPAISTSLVQ